MPPPQPCLQGILKREKVVGKRIFLIPGSFPCNFLRRSNAKKAAQQSRHESKPFVNHLGRLLFAHEAADPDDETGNRPGQVGRTSVGFPVHVSGVGFGTEIVGMQDLETSIRERAYQIWIDSGRQDGHADAHWLAAQREILSVSLSAIGRTEVCDGRTGPTKVRPSRKKKRAA